MVRLGAYPSGAHLGTLLLGLLLALPANIRLDVTDSAKPSSLLAYYGASLLRFVLVLVCKYKPWLDVTGMPNILAYCP